jgi:4-oxalomesaconate tautomerase
MNLGDVTQRSVPKMCLIAEAIAGGAISSRSFIPHKCHTSIGVFGAVSVASACLIVGSVTQSVARVPAGEHLRLSVEHPTGEFTVELQLDNGSLVSCGLLRTSRLLFDGQVCVPHSVWSGKGCGDQ